MFKFLRTITYFSIPFFIWALIVVLVDPFNYFNKIHLIERNAKINAENLNTLLYRSIDFVNRPTNNILIGDSRTDALPLKLIEKYSKKEFKKLNTNATKLNEIFELFYMANERKKIDKVVIGINFNMFNKFSYENRVNSIKKIINNPFLYIYNKDVLEACYFVLRSHFFNVDLDSKPKMNREEFWKWTVDVKGDHWYGKYAFPNTLYNDLIEFDDFTKNNKTEVIFIIVPHHKDFHQRLIDYKLLDEEKRFKELMSSLNAKVFDFDYPNSITQNNINFIDPIHYNDSIGKLMVEEIWNNKILIGKKL